MLFTAFIIAAVSLIATALALGLALYSAWLLLAYKAPFVKTPQPIIEAVLNNINAQPGQTLYDLGCGDAELLIAAEKKFGVKTVGFETSPFAWQKARYNIAVSRANTKLIFKNFFNADLSPADMIYCFLVPALMPRLAEKLKTGLRPGTKVISYAYPLPGWTTVKTISPLPNSQKSSKIYIYEFAKK